MMAAYPQQGAMHPGMAPHGHPPMTPGQPMTPAQMQQMGIAGGQGPGAPHVTQGGAVMAMQPGANGMGGPGMGGQHPGAQMAGMPGQMGGQSMPGGVPNAHAMSQFNPQQAAMQQQQQQMMQAQLQQNPHLAMQHHQQIMARRQQQMAQLGMQPSMQNMTPQQLQQLQALQQHGNPAMVPQGVQLPQHLQMKQMQLQMAAQQQQQQQQQHQLAAQQQNQAMQQQLAMQHANSQHSNQGGQGAPSGQPGGQPQPGQPGQAQQLVRPQSRTANPNEQTSGVTQQGSQQTAQQGAQQSAQQNQQQAQQQQGQQQQVNPQAMQVMNNQRRMAQMQYQHLQAQQRQLAQQNQQQGSGVFILKVMSLADQLSSFNGVSGRDVGLWHAFVEKNFSGEGRLMHAFLQEGRSAKVYEVLRPTIARYFHMYFDTPAISLRLHTEQGRETTIATNRHQVAFQNVSLAVTYPNGVRLDMIGGLNVLFAPASDLIECFELSTIYTEEHIVRSEVEKVLNAYSPTMGNKASPKMTKTKTPKAQQKLQAQFEGLTIDRFPKAPTGSLGIAARVQHFLEIGETMNVMSDLISFAQEKKMRPETALEAINTQYENQGEANAQQPNQQGNPQINLPPNGVQMGNRTPSMQNMQMPGAQGVNQFSSPHVANLNLPMHNGMPGAMNGSPHLSNSSGLAPNMNMANSHTPSPHQGNMAAPAMVLQHSQQGTNSSAASANTSPQVNNKRRRSTVKMEADGGEDSNAGGRVKPSPRMPKKPKPGGAG